MSAYDEGDEVSEIHRYRLGKLLSERTRHLLLLTATPYTAKEEDFQLFLSVLDADCLEGRRRSASGQMDTSDLIRHIVKDHLLRFDGRPRFPGRRAYTVHFELSPAELDLYEPVTTYVVEEMNRAERLISGRRDGLWAPRSALGQTAGRAQWPRGGPERAPRPGPRSQRSPSAP
jgi:hypothetical protein